MAEAGSQALASGLGVGAGAATDTGIALTKANKRLIQKKVEDETIRLATEAGYKLDPAKIRPGPVVSALEYIGGKTQIAADFAQHNANVTLALAKKSLGLDVSDVLNVKAIEAVKKEAGLAYEAIGSISPRARAALEQYKRANEFSHSYYMDSKSPMPGNRVESKENAELWKDRAESAWMDVEDEINKAGKPELIPLFNAAKKRIAKANVVLEAFNEGNGRVSAQIISKARESRGSVLDAELDVIHRFAQAFPEEAGADVAKKEGGVVFNRLTSLAALGLAGGAAKASGVPTGYTLAGITAMALAGPKAARSFLSDPALNRALATRNYKVEMPQDFRSLASQRAISSVGMDNFQQNESPAPRSGLRLMDQIRGR
jgi:precorrin-2 methylase